jgi:CHAD domain-containing protein
MGIDFMADGKWIADLGPDLALEQAARLVLEVRLHVVRDSLPRAVFDADEDVEHVHQLRVGTRRADAALRIFRSQLPRRVYRSARGHLRTIRRAAGAARDWDVFLLALNDRHREAAAPEQPGLDFLIGYALGQRQAAQAQLSSVDESEGEELGPQVQEIVEAVRVHEEEKEDARLIDLARPLLSQMLHNLHRTASGDLKNYEQLHQVRIAGKRLRYAMEVFADCFPQEFKEEYYPLVEEMQDILGRANDSHVAGIRLGALRERLRAHMPDLWEQLKPGIEGLLHWHNRRLPQERRKFLKWWERWRAARVEERLFGMVGTPE